MVVGYSLQERRSDMTRLKSAPTDSDTDEKNLSFPNLLLSAMFQRPLVLLFLATAAGITAGHHLHGYLHEAAAFLWLVPLLLTAPSAVVRSGRWPWLICGAFSAGLALDVSLHQPSTLAEIAAKRGVHRIEATVCEPLADYRRYRRTIILVHRIFVENTPVKVEEYVLFKIYGPTPSMHPGDGLELRVRLSPFKNFNNPGGYDYAGRMALKGIACSAYQVSGHKIKKTEEGRLPVFRSMIEKIRRPVRDLYTDKLSPGKPRALLRALILGEKQELEREVRNCFARTGLGHVLAVSGLHIGLVGWTAFTLAMKLITASYRLSLAVVAARWAALLCAFPVIMYTCLAGFQISSRRAMIMACTYLAALFIGRRKDLWSTLALAGLIVVVTDPHSLFTVSFQLSFTAVAGIIWLAPILIKAANPVVNAVPAGFPRTALSYITGLAALTITVTVFLAPLLAHYFQRLSLISLPANMTVVPLLGTFVVPSGLLSAFAALVYPPAAGMIARFAEAGVQALIHLVQFWDSFAFTSVYVPVPNRAEVLLLYALICFTILSVRHPRARIMLIAAVAVFIFDAAYWTYRLHFNSDLRITFLDVGHGNAAVIEMPRGTRMVVDGGGFPGGGFDTGEMLIAPFLRSRKIMSVHYLVLSHPQTDHFGGLQFIADHFGPGELWYNGIHSPLSSYKNLMLTLDRSGTALRAPPELPESFLINGVRIEILHPRDIPDLSLATNDSSAVNNTSLVMRVCYQGSCILFTGDIERETEELLTAEIPDLLSSLVLLVPHHGSRSSSTPAFLKAVSPQACIVSARNRGHSSVASRLEALDVPIFRTSEQGAVEVTINRKGCWIKPFITVGGGCAGCRLSVICYQGKRLNSKFEYRNPKQIKIFKFKD
ncbi:MAG TPA: DNA internalization-related competence protein ComEC/Rec2 [Desulfobacteraceae bacterium]|nr:DNA internalization-related competence protein ComEC/Rec2 [Desulfobacteraceae bacterium]